MGVCPNNLHVFCGLGECISQLFFNPTFDYPTDPPLQDPQIDLAKEASHLPVPLFEQRQGRVYPGDLRTSEGTLNQTVSLIIRGFRLGFFILHSDEIYLWL